MGVLLMWLKTLEGVKAGEKRNLSELKGKSVGVYLSIWLYQACGKEGAAEAVTITPRYAADAVIQELEW